MSSIRAAATRRDTPSRQRAAAPQSAVRILFANITTRRYLRVLEALAPLGVTSAGLARSVDEVQAVSSAGDADVVVLGQARTEETLELVRWVAHEASLPVVLALPSSDPEFVAAAADRGAYGAVIGTRERDWQSTLRLALARAEQYRNLQDAFTRRAVVERAKGILMARNDVDEREAFELLRGHARSHSRRVVDVAKSVVESNQLRHEGGEKLSG
jgi:response regulator NasT